MLKASELHSVRDDKTKRNREMYKQLFEDVCKKIRKVNMKGSYTLMHSVKYITVGLPLYNVDHAVLYIIRKLTKGGFEVQRITENTIYITWSRA